MGTLQVLMMPDYRPDNPYQRLLAEGLEGCGVKVHFPVGYRRGLPLWRAWRAAPEARVLHLHWTTPYLRGKNFWTQTAYCVRLLADIALLKASGVGVVWTVHNRVSHEARWPRLERWVQRRLAAQAGRVIIHARANLEEMSHDLDVGVDKITVVPHGHYKRAYGPPVESAAARQALGLPASGRVYLYFGMLRPYKGLEKLIAEWQVTGNAAGDVLVIAGKALDGGYLRRVREAAAGCNTIRILPEFVPVDQVPLYFSAADVAVLPFATILTSGSLLLAMSYGTPVVAPRFGALAEMAGEADDLLYDPDDPRGLRQSLERSARLDLAPLRAKTEKMCQRLDWNLLAGMTLHAYQQSLCPASGPRQQAMSAERSQ